MYYTVIRHATYDEVILLKSTESFTTSHCVLDVLFFSRTASLVHKSFTRASDRKPSSIPSQQHNSVNPHLVELKES